MDLEGSSPLFGRSTDRSAPRPAEHLRGHGLCGDNRGPLSPAFTASQYHSLAEVCLRLKVSSCRPDRVLPWDERMSLAVQRGPDRSPRYPLGLPCVPGGRARSRRGEPTPVRLLLTLSLKRICKARRV